MFDLSATLFVGHFVHGLGLNQNPADQKYHGLS